MIALASADVKGFHYDTNYLFNEVVDNATHRTQSGQTLSVSHPLVKNFGISGEIYGTSLSPFSAATPSATCERERILKYDRRFEAQ